MSQQPIPDIEKIRQLNEANQALKKQQERLELIIQGTNDGIWDWNIETGQFYFSERWLNMLGYQNNDIEQSFHGWLELVHPDDLGRFLLTWTEYMEGITSHFDIEYRLKHQDGYFLWVEGKGVSSINEDGFPYRMAGANSDIHSRKMAEEKLIQTTQTAEDAVNSQKRFLSTMSHELRTPLNAIIGFSEIIKDELEEQEDTVITKDVNRIYRAGTHLLGLVNQVLDIASSDNQNLKILPSAFEIQRLLSDIQEKFTPQVTQNNIHYAFADNLGNAQLDYKRVLMAVINLLDNANKFTHQGDITLNVSKDEHCLYFKVIDTGIGIPTIQLKTIFDPFIQGDSNYNRKYEGSGLGLTISKHYAHLMGGDVSVKSTLDQGSTFTLKVPIEWAPPPQQ